MQRLTVLLAIACLFALSGCNSPVADRPAVEPATDATAAVEGTTPAATVIEGASDPAPIARQVPAGELEGTVYGEGVTLDESMPISEILDNVDDYLGQRVRIEGLVVGVCETKGCWIDIESDRPFETMRLKFEDGVVVFPVSAGGAYAVGEGVVARIEYDLEQTKEHLRKEAEEKGETFDPDTVTEPLTMVRLDGTGAVVREP